MLRLIPRKLFLIVIVWARGGPLPDVAEKNVCMLSNRQSSNVQSGQPLSDSIESSIARTTIQPRATNASLPDSCLVGLNVSCCPINKQFSNVVTSLPGLE